MSFSDNHSINGQNYEEWLLLYVDNELTADQREAVDAFLLAHPELKGELTLLQSTRLPLTEETFTDKADLLAEAMKLNAVDEELLLYIDDELPAAQRKAVQQKIAADESYALQHSLLRQTKLDPSENFVYPNKEELYRRTERRVLFVPWMRIAAAVVLVLFGSLFFLLKEKGDGDNGSTIAGLQPKTETRKADGEERKTPAARQPAFTETASVPKREQQAPQPATLSAQPKKAAVQQNRPANDLAHNEANATTPTAFERPVVKFDATRFAAEAQPGDAVALNKTIAREPVTTGLAERTTTQEEDSKTAGFDADFKPTKRTPAKGFFRKVTRFVERRTGIGTVNDENELLIGAVALKLK